MRDALAADIVLTARLVRRHTLYSVTVVLTMAIGIALCAAAVTLTDAILLRPLPYAASDRLATIYLASPSRNLTGLTLAYEEYRDLAEHREAFESTAAYVTGNAVLAGDNDAERVPLNFVSASYFAALQRPPHLGRTFVAKEDEGQGGAPVAILSYGLWTRRFGGSSAVLGTTIRLDDVPLTIVGVLGAEFVDLSSPRSETEVWLPISMVPRFAQPSALSDRRTRVFSMVARLANGKTTAGAQAELNAIALQWERDHADTNRGFDLVIVPLQTFVLGNLRPHLIALSCAASCVLLIASVNIANLMLIRGGARMRELAIRRSIGATERRLVRQLFTESFLLSSVGVGAGLLAGPALVKVLLSLSPMRLPQSVKLTPDGAATMAMVALAGLVAISSSLWPAVQLSRTEAATALNAENRGATTDRTRRRWQRILVAVQVALATTLSMAAASAVMGFAQLRAVDSGYKPDALLTFRMNLNAVRYAQNADRVVVAERLIEEIQRLPGIATADIWSPNMPGSATWLMLVAPEGRPRTSVDGWTTTRRHHVTPDGLEHLGLTRVAGRGIERSDRVDTEPVVVVSESLARRLWPAESAVGQRMWSREPPPQPLSYRVVGVVRDAKHLGRSASAAVDGGRDAYYAFAQIPRRELSVVVRSTLDRSSIAAAAQQAVRRVDPTLVAYDVATMDQRMAADESRFRFSAVMIGALGALAVGLAALGIYGVLGYTVLERTREIGIQLAVGATPQRVLTTTLVGGMKLIAIGLLAGIAATAALMPIMRSLTQALGAVDLRSGFWASGVILGAGAAASVIPAYRASRIDPIEALRGTS